MLMKIQVDQVSNFMSHDVKPVCNEEGIEIVNSSVNDQRATGCVSGTIVSLENLAIRGTPRP